MFYIYRDIHLKLKKIETDNIENLKQIYLNQMEELRKSVYKSIEEQKGQPYVTKEPFFVFTPIEIIKKDNGILMKNTITYSLGWEFSSPMVRSHQRFFKIL